jgi:GTP-binding protein EngB required for normal cell division
MVTVTHGLLQRKRLLTERQSEIHERLRITMEQLVAALEKFGTNTAPADMRTIRDTLTNVEELFLLVIAGEFNSGKSSFINALLGASVLPEGVTPTTDRITVLRYGDSTEDTPVSAALREQTYPADLLRQLAIVDTPGTNAVIREHEELTRTFIPRADLVLFTTSADRPFTESERDFLGLIKEWGKKVVFILNKVDILKEHELQQVLEFIRTHARTLLGTTPEIFPVSARWAIKARNNEDGDALWAASRMGAVENYIVETLDEETRVRLKLLSPLGVGEHLVRSYLSATETRLSTLREDFVTLDNIEQQLGLFRDDLRTDVQYHLTEIDAILRDLEERGDKFFEDTIRIGRIPDLIRSERIRTAFEQEVIGDVAHQIDQRVQRLIDWMIEKDLRLWQSVVDYINRRRAAPHREHLIGEIGATFDYNRGALLESVGQAAGRVVKSYDRSYESQQLADEVRASIAGTAIAQVGAVGLGTAAVILAKTAFLDITGVLAASLIAFGGFYLIPAKRRQAKKAFQERVNELRSQIRQNVERQFDSEVEQSLGRVREAIGPYTRFVRAQREQLGDLQRTFTDIDLSLQRLREEIEVE